MNAAVVNKRFMTSAARFFAAMPRPEPQLDRAVVSVKPMCSECNEREICLPCALQTTTEGLVYTRRRTKRGDALYRAGDEFTSLYVIRAGFFKSRVVLADGRDQVIGFHMAREVIGMDGIGTDLHATDTIALEDSEVCVIQYTRLLQPDMQSQLYKIMSRELVRDQGVIMLLGTMRAEERLAAFLMNLSQRFLARGFSPREFHLRMTREDIGSYLGLSLETVSRLFSRFQADGVVTVQQKHVQIHDIAALKAVLNRDA